VVWSCRVPTLFVGLPRHGTLASVRAEASVLTPALAFAGPELPAYDGKEPL
jgi:hypothetical protein